MKNTRKTCKIAYNEIRYEKNKLMTNITKRIISGTFLALIVLTALLFSQVLLNFLLASLAYLMYREWHDMTKTDERLLFIGMFIVFVPLGCIYYISTMQEGRIALLVYALIIASVDTFAMIGGKMIGGAKLAPKISPNKTWSGLSCGVFSAGIMAMISGMFIRHYNVQYSLIQYFMAGVVLGGVEQCSDLFISSFKRKFHIKDSGNIIPGHGGVLDRFDGIILTAPLFLLMLS